MVSISQLQAQLQLNVLTKASISCACLHMTTARWGAEVTTWQFMSWPVDLTAIRRHKMAQNNNAHFTRVPARISTITGSDKYYTLQLYNGCTHNARSMQHPADTMPCWFVIYQRRFGKACCLHIQGNRRIDLRLRTEGNNTLAVFIALAYVPVVALGATRDAVRCPYPWLTATRSCRKCGHSDRRVQTT
jgi:hypothetical protein